ncbi:MAG TPA: hypothetical protein VH969_24570 [Actinophytocola sp.]|jgi:hypothetical protein|uniref:hypothetical protein n=1 Tax=Actinophytocola sp. TaxID=1872138 RepID=UPI002F94BF55
MSEKTDTDTIRLSQVLAGALAAVTAAVLGSTMGVAGTVVGAGLASVVTTVGGAVYLRSIQRTRQGVRSVRNMVVAHAGRTSVTLLEERTEPETGADERPGTGEEPGEETSDRTGTEQPPAHRRLRWPALIVASVLAFVVGMMVVTGVEWLRGESLSGNGGTTVGRIVRSQPDGGGDRQDTPPATRTSTVPSTGPSTVTVTQVPPTSGNNEPQNPPAGSGTADTTPPRTTTDAPPDGSVSVPTTGQAG